MDMARERRAQALISDIMRATRENDSPRALALMTMLETDFSNTMNFIINGSACLIETGDISNDGEMVRRGRTLGLKTLADSRIAKEHEGVLCFNVGNGYYTEFKIDQRSGKNIDYYAYEPLQCAKEHYRRALASRPISEYIKKQASVNLANVYDSVGRSV